jgi:hypothetical protein
LAPGVNVINPFSATDATSKKRVFVQGKFLQANLMFVNKAGAYPSGAPFGAPNKVKNLGLIANIRLGNNVGEEGKKVL